jgi:hypothetical protein
LCGLVALGLREDAALTLVFFGGALAWIGARPALAGGGLLDGSPRPGTLVAGTLLAGGGAAALLLYYLAIVPRFGGWGPSHFYVYPFSKPMLCRFARTVDRASAPDTPACTLALARQGSSHDTLFRLLCF